MTVEIERVRRISDMLTTAHSILRDRYALRSLLLDSCILVFSAWTCAFAFADQELVKKLTLPYASPLIAIGVLAVCTFALSLVQARVDWKEKSAYFGTAANTFAVIKLRARDAAQASVEDGEQMNEVYRLYQDAGNQFQIPDRSFLNLKRQHMLKQIVSKQLDETPGVPVWLILFKLGYSDLIRLMRGKLQSL